MHMSISLLEYDCEILDLKLEYKMSHKGLNFIQILGFFTVVTTFNIDTQMPLVFSGNKGSYFGAASELLINTGEKWLIVGAPQDNFTIKSDITKPGQVYKCRIDLNRTITKTTDCSALDLRTGTRTDKPPMYGESGQLLGSNIIITDTSVIVCAPRWQNVFSKWMTGFCHQMDRHNLTNSLQRFIRLSSRLNEVDLFSMAAFGFSGTATNDDKYGVVITTPYALHQKGGFALYAENEMAGYLEKFNMTTDVSAGSMFGYAIASGQFGAVVTDKPQLAIGAPGFVNEDGVVGLITILSIEGQTLVTLKQLTGDQVGGGFGQVVCVTDVNGDGHDDVIAGNPYHFSSDAKGQTMFDVGSVDIYLGTGNNQILYQKKVVLHGARKQSARFGSAITSADDITNDSYNDIIIGAPYEDDMKGAIYVFNGRSDIRTPQWIYSQRISSSELGMELKSFGFQISRNMEDIDNNTYKDISVGSYLSDTTVVLRTRAIANVNCMIKVAPEPIPLNSSELLFYNNTNDYPFFTVKVCFNVTGKGIDRGMFIKYNLTADTRRVSQKKRSRVLMSTEYMADNGIDSITEKKLLIQRGEQKCDVLFAYAPTLGQDFFLAVKSPLTFEVNFDLSNESIENNVLPILNKNLALSAERSVFFLTDCADAKCRADYAVEITPVKEAIILGESDEIKFNIFVANYGQPYNKQVTTVKLTSTNNTEFLRFSAFLNEGSQKVDCKSLKDVDDNVYTLCEIYGLLYPHQFAKFSVTYDASIGKVFPPNTLSVYNKIEVMGLIEVENDVEKQNNIGIGVVDINLEADIQVNGASEKDQLRLSNDDPFIDYIQTFYIENKGPSPLQQLLVTLAFPANANDEQILDLNTLEVSTDDGTECQMVEGAEMNDTLSVSSIIDPSNSNVEQKKSRQNITCGNGNLMVQCVYTQCQINMLQPKVLRTITAYSNLSSNALSVFLKDFRRVSYIVVGKVSLPGKPFFQTKLRKVNAPKVILDIFPQIVSPSAQKVDIWMIIGVSVGGLFLFLLFGILLWKCGFFKRRKRNQMDEFKRKGHYRQSATLQLAEKEPFVLRH